MITRSSRRWPGVSRRATAVLLVASALAGCAGHAKSASQTYGGRPTFLPSTSFQPDAELTASPARPALTVEGDSVLVHVGQASVRATVSGPVVPGEGLPNPPPATTCTWTVALEGISGQAPVNVADFSTIDDQGTVYHPTLLHGSTAHIIAAGQRLNLTLRAVMRTGEGLMRWAPGGPPILASWDFEVEND